MTNTTVARATNAGRHSKDAARAAINTMAVMTPRDQIAACPRPHLGVAFGLDDIFETHDGCFEARDRGSEGHLLGVLVVGFGDRRCQTGVFAGGRLDVMFLEEVPHAVEVVVVLPFERIVEILPNTLDGALHRNVSKRLGIGERYDVHLARVVDDRRRIDGVGAVFDVRLVRRDLDARDDRNFLGVGTTTAIELVEVDRRRRDHVAYITDRSVGIVCGFRDRDLLRLVVRVPRSVERIVA